MASSKSLAELGQLADAIGDLPSPLHIVDLPSPLHIVDLTSPLNSVDESSKDRMIVQEELEKRLKQRAGRQNLVERNILPPLSLPTASKLFTNTQQLHRAKIADNLQKKMRNRPGRDNLLQMNILPDLQVNVDPALQAKQLQLRKIKLADALNDKLAHRPGPLQLLQEGIIEPQLSQVVKGCELERNTPPNESSSVLVCRTNSNTSFAPASVGELPEIFFQSSGSFSNLLAGQQRHSIAGSTSSTDMMLMDTSPCSAESPHPHASFASNDRKFSDSSLSPAPSPKSIDDAKSPEKSPRGFNSSYPPLYTPVLSPGILSTSCGKSASSASAIRKKQQKKYRKLRYHEYVPPSKSTPKGGKTTPKPPSKSDSPYSSILQQQQLFLQFQVLQQQYPNGNLMQKIPEMISNLSKDPKSIAVTASKGRISTTSPSEIILSKQISLPHIVLVEVPNKYNTSSVRFEDLKVSDLKVACKEMGMTVSGKKAELVERLIDHNKGVLPAVALPENLVKETRRHALSLGQASSVDSQLSTSPSSPTSSPVFQFPSERGGVGGNCGIESGIGNSAPSGGSGKVPSNCAQLAELHKEFNEMFERQKRNYICQKGMSVEKSIAPRPELSELLAMKLPTTSNGPPPPQPPLVSFASLHLEQQQQLQQQQLQQRIKGSTLPSRGRVVTNSLDTKLLLAVTDKASRSLPSSPKSGSPQPPLGHTTFELMESSCGSSDADGCIVTTNSIPIPSSSISSGQPTGGGGVGCSARDVIHTDSTSGGTMVTLSNSIDQIGSNEGSISLSTSFYQQLPTPSSVSRHGHSSLPVTSSHHAGPPSMGLPSYNSVMQSRGVTGAHLSVTGLALPLGMNNGLSYSTDVRGLSTPSNEMASKSMNHDLFTTTDSMDVSMDTENTISDIFDILGAEGEVMGEDFSHPPTLPTLMGGGPPHHPPHHTHSLPHIAQYGTSPTKNTAGMHHDISSTSPSSSTTQAANPMLGNILPFGNPPLSSQQKSGSDICLNLPEGRDGHKNSIDGPSGNIHLYVPNNLALGNDLNWLDLDNTGGLGLSPTLNNTFGSLTNSHSNPGSLPHDQFHSAFLEDGMGMQMGMMGASSGMAKNSNSVLNSYGMPPHCIGSGEMSFLDPAMMQQSGLYPATEEERLLELGLSTS